MSKLTEYASIDTLLMMVLVVVAALFAGRLLAYPGQLWQLALLGALALTIAGGLALRYFSRRYGAGDERLAKAVAWAGRNAFLTVMALIAGAAVLHDLGVLPMGSVRTGEALTGSLIIMLALFALWYAYYFTRGDVA